MHLFHGSKYLFDKFDLSMSKCKLDFGRGIYLSDSYLSAEAWALRKSRGSGYIYTVLWDEYDWFNFSSSSEWLEYCLNSRGIINSNLIIPIPEGPIIGPILDNNYMDKIKTMGNDIYNFSDSFMLGNTNQYVFKTYSSIEHISIIKVERVLSHGKEIRRLQIR